MHNQILKIMSRILVYADILRYSYRRICQNQTECDAVIQAQFDLGLRFNFVRLFPCGKIESKRKEMKSVANQFT